MFPIVRAEGKTAAVAIFAISFVWGMTFIWMKQGIEAAESAVPDIEANWPLSLLLCQICDRYNPNSSFASQS